MQISSNFLATRKVDSLLTLFSSQGTDRSGDVNCPQMDSQQSPSTSYVRCSDSSFERKKQCCSSSRIDINQTPTSGDKVLQATSNPSSALTSSAVLKYIGSYRDYIKGLDEGSPDNKAKAKEIIMSINVYSGEELVISTIPECSCRCSSSQKNSEMQISSNFLATRKVDSLLTLFSSQGTDRSGDVNCPQMDSQQSPSTSYVRCSDSSFERKKQCCSSSRIDINQTPTSGDKVLQATSNPSSALTSSAVLKCNGSYSDYIKRLDEGSPDNKAKAKEVKLSKHSCEDLVISAIPECSSSSSSSCSSSQMVNFSEDDGQPPLNAIPKETNRHYKGNLIYCRKKFGKVFEMGMITENAQEKPVNPFTFLIKKSAEFVQRMRERTVERENPDSSPSQDELENSADPSISSSDTYFDRTYTMAGDLSQPTGGDHSEKHSLDITFTAIDDTETSFRTYVYEGNEVGEDCAPNNSVLHSTLISDDAADPSHHESILEGFSFLCYSDESEDDIHRNPICWHFAGCEVGHKNSHDEIEEKYNVRRITEVKNTDRSRKKEFRLPKFGRPFPKSARVLINQFDDAQDEA